MISNDNQTLFVGHISKDWGPEDLREQLSLANIEGVQEVTLMKDPTNRTKNRGFAFIEFDSHSLAAKAHGNILCS